MSDQFVGRAYSEDVYRTAFVIEKTCGAVPQTCPWWAFNHPLVSDVMTVRKQMRAKALPHVRDIPVRVLDAMAFFDDALKAARADRMERERVKREAERKKQARE